MTDYEAIRKDNERRYGTDIGRIGPMLLANRYDDRTHFIFELLQNAEDALARRTQWTGSRSISFKLDPRQLIVSHYGKPFDERDVRGICGIAESTKDITSIGRFGIGFKSVYAFTDRPTVHSGGESFAISSFVWPSQSADVSRSSEETVFTLPLLPSDTEAHNDIERGLKQLGARTLLFLREIEEIAWSVVGGSSGLYLRGAPEPIADGVRRVALIGETKGGPEIEETWLVFSSPAKATSGAIVGHVEVAFSLQSIDSSWSIKAETETPLVVFFPTVIRTQLGFIVQGPYRTTPSRDNVPLNDDWNRALVTQTAELLKSALHWLRDQKLLDVAALKCLPLDRGKFAQGTRFAPLFESVKAALSTEALLPIFGGGYAQAEEVRLGRTQELRELFSGEQLAELFDISNAVSWLHEDITQDRAPEVRQYLLHELDMTEVTPESILPKLSRAFLELQTDDWIIRLYQFLSGQPALMRLGRIYDTPLVRLEDGTHVVAVLKGQPQAFLPSNIETGFPIVRRAVAQLPESRKFLESLHLTEPDPVDDVVWNVLPKYKQSKIGLDPREYERDIQRIQRAFRSDSKTQRDKLVSALQQLTFVRAIEAGNATKYYAAPGKVYLATERLKELFSGVDGVLIVDDSFSCLRGEEIRELLEACGATRYLLPELIDSNFSREERRQMRRNAGCENSSRAEEIRDYTLRGLDVLLSKFPDLDPTVRRRRAEVLWDALIDVGDRRGSTVFSGSYQWFFFNQQSSVFDARFVRQLNKVAWIPSGDGNALVPPSAVLFESLRWKQNPFLESRITFRPPLLHALAEEAGIEPAVLDLLKRLGVTSEADLRARLGISEDPDDAEPGDKAEESERSEDAEKSGGHDGSDIPNARDFSGTGLATASPPASGASASSNGSPDRNSSADDQEGDNAEEDGGFLGGRSEGNGSNFEGDGTQGGAGPMQPARRSPSGRRDFVSYVSVRNLEDVDDPDGLDRTARAALEAQAIALIKMQEPALEQAPPLNEGYDLYELDHYGQPARWVEVKAMKASLEDRPVGLSRAQFEFARQNRATFWLYVVEHADDPNHAKILRIHDPVGKAKTFTFDHGWSSVSEDPFKVRPQEEDD